MSDAKHTPGPWHLCWRGRFVVPDGDQNKLYGGAVNPDIDRANYFCQVCEVRGIDRDHERRRSKEEAEANARLISASPDLLAVVRAYERWEADLIESDEAWGPDGTARPSPGSRRRCGTACLRSRRCGTTPLRKRLR